MVGLGRMGLNMTRRLVRGGHRVVAWNRSPAPVAEVERDGAIGAHTLVDLVERLTPPRAVWLMLPAGRVTTQFIEEVAPLLAPGDTIVDGGNANFRDSQRRADDLTARGFHFLDAGVSGGIWGLQVGFCLMLGGEEPAYRRLEPLLRTLAPENGYMLAGPHGAGHFVKMVHNAIEYGMMQSIGEGFELLQASGFPLDLPGIAELWNHGSVVRSWLMELAQRALAADPRLESIRGYVEDSGEGRWAVQESIERAVPMPVITLSLLNRFRSRQEDSFSARMLAALRNQFGGHAIREV
jgi:6-phosphogluconate dehydrogenase